MVNSGRHGSGSADSAENKVNPEKTFCEFFAGIGLVRMGLDDSGWSCVYANDINEKKREIYDLNFRGGEDFHLADVWDTEAVVDRITKKPFLATASFPCIDLSLAGHGRGFEGEHSSAFFGFSKVINALGENRPSVILLENVTGFLTSKNGQDFEAAMKCLSGLGYWIDTFLLDAKFFVPQSRPRVFVVCVHESLGIPLFDGQCAAGSSNDQWGRKVKTASKSIRPSRLVDLVKSIKLPTGWIAFDVPEPEIQRPLLSKILDVDDDQEWWDSTAVSKHYDSMSDKHREIVDRMISENAVFVGTIFRRKRQGTTRAEVRFDGIAGCLRTPKGGSAKQIVIEVRNGRIRMRWMSPREYARLQGADDFQLVGNKIQNLHGFGDAVCVPVIEWIDRFVLTPLFENTASSLSSLISSPTSSKPAHQRQLF